MSQGEGTGGAAPASGAVVGGGEDSAGARAALTGAVAGGTLGAFLEFERLEPCAERGNLALKKGQAPNGDEWDHEAGNTRHGGHRNGEQHRVTH